MPLRLPIVTAPSVRLVSDPFEKYEDATRHEYWIKVLVEDRVGWVKSTYLNIDWVDPEEYV